MIFGPGVKLLLVKTCKYIYFAEFLYVALVFVLDTFVCFCSLAVLERVSQVSMTLRSTF